MSHGVADGVHEKLRKPLLRSRAPTRVELVLSCEHASAEVPAALKGRLGIPPALLLSHRGWDPGALPLAEALGRPHGVRPIAGRVSRLVVDLNRSADNRRSWSEFARRLDPSVRARLLREHHASHWRAVEAAIGTALGPVLHVSVHSFTPRLDGLERTMDVGILYDPARAREVDVARRWKAALHGSGLRVTRNAPYRGRADGITRGMRARFDDARYAGLELELSQALVVGGRVAPAVVTALCDSLALLVDSAHPLPTPQAPSSAAQGR